MGKESKNKKFQHNSTPANAAGNSGGSSGGGGGGGKKDRLGGTLVAPLKSFGQNFLKNPMVVQGIVDKANIKPTDVVFEIGPGTGNLTVELLKRAKKVICVEFDRRMVKVSQNTVYLYHLLRPLHLIYDHLYQLFRFGSY